MITALLAAIALATRFEPPGEGPALSRFGFARWDVENGLPQTSVNDVELAARARGLRPGEILGKPFTREQLFAAVLRARSAPTGPS